MSSPSKAAAAVVRPYRAVDFPRLCELDRICFPEAIAYSPEEIWASLLQRGSFAYVAEDAAKNHAGGALPLRGFVLAHAGRRGSGHIVTIDIDPLCRRRGIGALLMDTAEQRMAQDGCRRVVLEVATDNAAAIHFYEKRGYAIRKPLPHYYHDGSDAWLMEKHLIAKGTTKRMKTEKSR